MAKYAIFTMDVEAFCDTECLKNKGLENYNQMFDGINNYLALLEKYEIKADLFVIANIADQITDILQKAVSKGHKIAIHGLSHTPPMLLSNEQFKEDILTAKHKLETMLNTEVVGHRAPCFSINDERLNVLNEIGINYDSSYLNNPITYYHGNVNIKKFTSVKKGIYIKNNLFEFSIPKYKKIPMGGGGYIRLLPWSFIKGKLSDFLDNNEIYIFYLHPFEVSNIKLPRIKKIRPYDLFYLKRNRGLTYLERIEKIINMLIEKGYEFTTFEELLKKEI